MHTWKNSSIALILGLLMINGCDDNAGGPGDAESPTYIVLDGGPFKKRKLALGFMNGGYAGYIEETNSTQLLLSSLPVNIDGEESLLLVSMFVPGRDTGISPWTHTGMMTVGWGPMDATIDTTDIFNSDVVSYAAWRGETQVRSYGAVGEKITGRFSGTLTRLPHRDAFIEILDGRFETTLAE